LVISKAGAQHELLFYNTGGFVEHLSPTKVAQQIVTEFVAMIAMSLVAPKAAARHKHFFNKPASGLYIV
jgi:hypothetical protein